MDIVTIFHKTIVLMLVFNNIKLVALQTSTPITGLIGYDCGTNNLNVTSISLYKPSVCDVNISDIITETVRVQVVQQLSLMPIHVIQCSIMTERRITHCGMHSHSSEVSGSYKHEIKQLSYQQCAKILTTGVYEYSNDVQIWSIKPNSTTRGEVIIVGTLQGSSCYGGVYRTPEYTWTDVVVRQQYTIKLYDYYTTADIPKDVISLRNGLSCKFSLGDCVDSLEGFITWKTDVNDDCLTNHYRALYTGYVNKTYSKIDSDNRVYIYSVLNDKTLFSIKTLEEIDVCGHPGYITDHQKIFIVEISNKGVIFKNTDILAKDLDVFTYFNSKINMLEHHIHNQLNLLYADIRHDLCMLEHKIVSTQLILAKLYPNDFANELMKSEGYTAVVAGESIYVIKCEPVYVIMRQTKLCYQEIPVYYNNKTAFMTPVTKIIQYEGQIKECSDLLPSKFKFGNKWFTIDTHIRETVEPQVITIKRHRTWSYTHIPSLMSAGIYSNEQVTKLKDIIYDNSLQRSATSYMNRALTGRLIQSETFDVKRLLTIDSIRAVIDSYWNKIFSWATKLGNFTSTMLGFWIIGKLIKFVIDTFMHGKILYSLYGFGWHLLASIWDSVTSYLAHNSINKKVNKSDTKSSTDVAESIQQSTITNELYPDPRLIRDTYPGSSRGIEITSHF
nr:TPA_asm: glycoprotein [Doliuvirus atrichopogon]